MVLVPKAGPDFFPVAFAILFLIMGNRFGSVWNGLVSVNKNALGSNIHETVHSAMNIPGADLLQE